MPKIVSQEEYQRRHTREIVARFRNAGIRALGELLDEGVAKEEAVSQVNKTLEEVVKYGAW